MGYEAGRVPMSQLRPPPSNMISPESRCPHRQAEPVVLTTGETVACLCVVCLEALPADYVDRQRDTAHAIAVCLHEDTAEITTWGSPAYGYEICTACGVTDPFLTELLRQHPLKANWGYL